jgi:hypothetical protein
MEFRRPLVLAATGVVVAALFTPTAVQAQPTTTTGVQSAEVMALDAASSLVEAKPTALHATADGARGAGDDGGPAYCSEQSWHGSTSLLLTRARPGRR